MKMVKSLFLGSAAGLLAMGGAQAADLPVKAKAVEYVRICSLYGAGFFYIPGTDTCIKLGGYLRADLNIHGGLGGQPYWNGDGGLQDRFANQYTEYSRLALTIDTRTATEYGVVRTFGQVDTTFATYGGGSLNVGSTLESAALGGALTNNTVGNGYTGLEFAFVQFAGFTLGKSASAFNTPWHGFPGNNTAFLVGGYDTVTGLNNAQYTWQFGNGVSATIGVDDSSGSGYNRTQLFNATLIGNPGGPGAPAVTIQAASTGASTFTTATQSGGNLGLYGATSSLNTVAGTAYSGAFVPDFVGNVRVDQAWGLFQISGAVHDVSPAYWASANTANASTIITGNNLTGTEQFGHPDSKFGGAVSAALQIKNIPTGAGDDVKVEGTWGLGATKYVLGTAGALPGSFYMTKASGAPGVTAGQIAIGAITDGVYGGWQTNLQSGVQLTRGWGFRGAFNHNWSPEWSSSLFGGIAQISYNDTAKALWCASYSSTTPGGVPITIGGARVTGAVATAVAGSGYSCDPGFTMSQIGLTTRWTPVKNLTFSSEVLYSYLTTNMKGQASGTTSSSFPVAGGNQIWQYGNVGTVNVNLRVQRNF
jgi:porin-like protein